VAELQELLPRYAHDNLFDSSKFKQAFPGFAVTSYRQGLALIADEFQKSAAIPCPARSSYQISIDS
jgi:hypothetical protein